MYASLIAGSNSAVFVWRLLFVIHRPFYLRDNHRLVAAALSPSKSSGLRTVRRPSPSPFSYPTFPAALAPFPGLLLMILAIANASVLCQ